MHLWPKESNMPSPLLDRLQNDLSRLTLTDDARVWVYIADRSLTVAECALVERHLQVFTKGWAAHGKPLNAQTAIVASQILILALDESGQAATGCSIDASVSMLKQICDLAPSLNELDLFDRSWVLYASPVDPQDWSRAKLHDFWAMRKAGHLDDDVLIVDSTVSNVGALRGAFVKRLADSWHAHMW